MTGDTYNTYAARVGDIIRVTVDGRAYDMTVWRIEPAGTAATRYAAGPHVMAWIRPGGYGVSLDAGNVEKYSARLVIPAAAADTPGRLRVMSAYRLVKMVRGYPLTSAGPYRVYSSRAEVLQALGPHEACHGDYAGTFNPRHPAATDYYLIARSTRDPRLVAVTDTPEGSRHE